MSQIVNTNSVFSSRIGEKFDSTYYQQVVGDNEERMVEAIELAASRSDLLFSGGLGPTTDDITSKYWRAFRSAPS